MSRCVRLGAFVLSAIILGTLGCGGGEGEDGRADEDDGGGSIPAESGEYVVLAWNDLGMHCLNPTYDMAVLLPPYNTVWAQVIRRGDPPRVVTSGLTAAYRIVDNTYSDGKTDSFGGDYAQFWDNVQSLFGAALLPDTGLNLVDPQVHNSLSGQMLAKGDHFQVDGIPATPVKDSGVWDPYQVAEITIRQGGEVVAGTRVTVSTSDEINCARCHEGNALENVLEEHDERHPQYHLLASAPVLCADCHGSPALGGTGPGSSGKYLSEAIHGYHADKGAGCLDCHPGVTTKCNRSIAHMGDPRKAYDGNCVICHGTMRQVAQSIESGSRIPWADEPGCVTCHTGVPGVETGATLYRNATGHGGLYCTACHHSPHAMYPSRETADSYQPLQYQDWSGTIGSCAACHESSRGEEFEDFGEEHAGPNGRPTSCRVCHTEVSTNTTAWPHAFRWRPR